MYNFEVCRSQWPRGLRRGSAAARGPAVVSSNPAGCMEVCCECCVLSGRGLCVGLITHRKDSYQVQCVCVFGVCVCVWCVCV